MIEGPDAKELWLPTLEFVNVLKIETIPSYGNTVESAFWFYQDHQDGHILEYNEEIILTLFCDFDFSAYPFDSHICNLTFGDDTHGFNELRLMPTSIGYKNELIHDGMNPLIIKDLPYPFEFHFSSIPSFNVTYDIPYSYTGICIKMKRKSLGLLFSGFYYPTGSFALLSMISYFIDADSVSINFLLHDSNFGLGAWFPFDEGQFSME